MNNPKHVLFLCSWYPNAIQVTNGNFIQQHAESIAKYNRVSVLHVQSSRSSHSFEIKQIEKGNLSETIVYFKKSKSPIRHLIRYYLAYKKAKKQIQLKHGKYDLTHVNHIYWLGLLALYNKIIKGEKYVVSEHYSGFITNQKTNFIKGILTKLIFKKSEYIIPVSETLKRKLVTIEPNLVKYHIVGNVIDTNVFSPSFDSLSNQKKQFIHISN